MKFKAFWALLLCPVAWIVYAYLLPTATGSGGAPTEAPITRPTVAPITPLGPTAGPRPTIAFDAPANPAVLANADVLRLLGYMKQRGIVLGDPHESRAAFLYPVAGVAYEFDGGHLYVHPFPSLQAAEQRARQIPIEMTPSVIDWIAPPHFCRCESAIVLYLGTEAHVIAALADVCSPVA